MSFGFFFKNNKGFTGIEVLVVIVIITTLGAVSLPIMKNLDSSANVYEGLTEIESKLRMARLRSMAYYGQAAHGVYFDIDDKGQGSIVLYQGNDYLSRTVSEDLVYAFSGSVSVSLSGIGKDMNFTAPDGRPGDSGAVVVRSNSRDLEETITITDIGLISDTIY